MLKNEAIDDLDAEGADEIGIESSPEHVTDDDIFDEEDFQTIEEL